MEVFRSDTKNNFLAFAACSLNLSSYAFGNLNCVAVESKSASVCTNYADLRGFDRFVNSMFLFGYCGLPPNLFLTQKNAGYSPRKKPQHTLQTVH